MDRKQLVAMWIGIAAIALMCLVPPWVAEVADTPRVTFGNMLGPARCCSTVRYARGYALIILPPRGAAGVDAGRLAVQSFVVVLLAGGAMLSKGTAKQS